MRGVNERLLMIAVEGQRGMREWKKPVYEGKEGVSERRLTLRLRASE